jgi:hypothetical protein
MSISVIEAPTSVTNTLGFYDATLATANTYVYFAAFSVAYDGQTATVDGGTPAVIGAGGEFQLNVHATGDAFWEVTAPLGDLTKWAGFNPTGQGAPRIMSTVSAFYLDGVQVGSALDLNTQQDSYLGAVLLPAGTLPVGFRFDQVSVGVSFLQGDVAPI